MIIANDVLGIAGASPEFYRGPALRVKADGSGFEWGPGDNLPAGFDAGVNAADVAVLVAAGRISQ